MSAAIFGLVGVIVGAAVSGWVTLSLERRREREARKAALHVLDVELLRARSYIESAIDDGVWTAGTETAVRSWDRYEDVLARSLRRDDFHFVALAVTSAERAPGMFFIQIAAGELVIRLSEADRKGLTFFLEGITRGQVVIGKQLGPWPAETRLEPPPLPKSQT